MKFIFFTGSKYLGFIIILSFIGCNTKRVDNVVSFSQKDLSQLLSDNQEYKASIGKLFSDKGENYVYFFNRIKGQHFLFKLKEDE